MLRFISRLACQTIPLVAGASLIAPPAAAQAPTFFIQASFDSYYITERGGAAPARGLGMTARPIAGVTGAIGGGANLTVLGGAAASRYAQTPESDTDTVFGMVTLSKTVEDYRFAASLLAAHSYDPTFETGVATVYDPALSVSRTFTPAALAGWSLTPQLKVTQRHSDLASARRWDLGASLELSRPAFGGTFLIGGGYDWLDYREAGRHDDKFSVSTSWLVDINQYMRVGVRSEASFVRSNVAGLSVNSFEIGPTLRVLFAR
jgi:hypothetical protein